MKTFRKMLFFIKPYTVYLLVGLMLSLLEIGAFFITPYIFKVFIDDVLGNHNSRLLYPIVCGYFIFIIFGVGFGVLKEYFFAVMNERIVKDARVFLYKELRKVELSKFVTFKIGSLMSYFVNDTPQMMGKVATDVIELIRNALRALIGIAVLAAINVKMLLILLLLLPAYVFNAVFFQKPIRGSSMKAQEQKSVISDTLEEHLSGTNEIMVFNRLSWDFRKVREVFEKYIHIAVKNTIWMRVSSDTGILIYFLATILIYLIGGNYVLKGMMTVGTLLFYANYMDNIYMPSRLMIDINNDLQNAIAVGERYFNFIDSMDAESKPGLASQIQWNEFTDKIEFQDVSFKYNNEYVLKNINLEIKKGEAVAVIGASGSGKSTLIKLLLNLYEPASGEISIDSQNLQSIEKHSFYDKVSVVFQEPFLFSGTIMDNISFSSPEATVEEVVQAAAKAGANEFIQQMESGYYSLLNERGSNISGGQKQRIAIARSILKNAEIYVFDEITSSLDSTNQGIICDAIAQLKREGKTVVLITHTLNNLVNMDKIIVLKDGQIRSIGSYDELMKDSKTNIELQH